MTYHSIVTNICPVCGYLDSEAKIFGQNGEYSYQEICPSCGTQFGYDDIITSHRILRKRWAKNGFNWYSKVQEQPENWDYVEQLKRLQFDNQEIENLVRLSDPAKYNDWEFLLFRNLDEAKKNKNVYLIVQGDYGRKIYFFIPVKLVFCSEKILEKLVKRIDKTICNNNEGLKINFEGICTGEIISAGTSKGIAMDKLWVHKELEPLKDKISDVISGIKEKI